MTKGGFMKATFLGALILTMGTSSAFAHGVTRAKAAELVLHRIERLVTLCNLGDPNQPINMPGKPGYDPKKCKNDPSKPKKGITPDYQNNIYAVTIALLDHETEEEPAFQGLAHEVKAEDGTQKIVEVLLDDEGRPLPGNTESGGNIAANAPVWPDKDPTTLSENALHYLIDNSPTTPTLKPFDNLKKFTITPVQLKIGDKEQMVAQVDIQSADTTDVLRVLVLVDGTFHKADIIKP